MTRNARVVVCHWAFAAIGALACSAPQSEIEGRTSAATFRVSSINELRTRISAARAGDTIIVANGTYPTSSDTAISRAGTANEPILITAETIGGVEIRGTHGITFDDGAAF